MLQQLCEYIHNYFIRKDALRISGTFSVSNGDFASVDGMVSPLSSLKEGQRFLVTGSDLNDGLYTYHSDNIRNDDDTAGAGLADEVFNGVVIGLSIPPQVIALSAEVNEWVGKYGDVINSPYQSESFGGYSYTRASGSNTRASGSNADGTGGVAGWQEVFGSRLKPWRKVAFL